MRKSFWRSLLNDTSVCDDPWDLIVLAKNHKTAKTEQPAGDDARREARSASQVVRLAKKIARNGESRPDTAGGYRLATGIDRTNYSYR
jgi:hypothetical protein